jgi:hypothetical protein
MYLFISIIMYAVSCVYACFRHSPTKTKRDTLEEALLDPVPPAVLAVPENITLHDRELQINGDVPFADA